MTPYKTKTKKFHGTRYGDARANAMLLFKQIEKRTKRRPYIKSDYFNKQKVFFEYFWSHLFQKGPKERAKRLQYFEAALELIRNSRNHPTSEENPIKKGEILHRFLGQTKDGELFYV